MSISATLLHNDLFSSLISDIKTYTGKDPLLPWLRGIRKMKESLTPQLLKEKLPRFLQKCAQTFETDRRYANDLRYLRVWLQLMDFVDDPRAVLRTMEANRIGMKKSVYYQAYALYYEKVKKFEEADRIYHLGVQNLAEPINELQKAYEQFLHRMERHKRKKIQCQERTKGKKVLEESFQSMCNGEVFSNDTEVVRFVDTAIVGKAETEDACHHGLVEPTINTKEALKAINSMFREPLEPEFANRRSHRTQPKADQRLDTRFEAFVEENVNEVGSSNQNGEKGFVRLQHNTMETNQSIQEPLQIYIDDEESNEVDERINVNAFVFPSPKDDLPAECSVDLDGVRSTEARHSEDTVVCRFVGATISDEPQVENVCHHGLVDPTVNLKEAMDDINSMFGKPIEFVRINRRERQEKAAHRENNCGAFAILPDDDLDYHQGGHSLPSSHAKNDSDLFEQTVCTKEAMKEINKMFGMPLDF